MTLMDRLRRIVHWLRRHVFVLELALIVLVGAYASRDYQNSDPNLVLNGIEAQWLTNSAYLSANTLRDYGYIPKWQPWLVHGEPAIDNPFSFVLNPLSTLPSWLFGAENGIKYSVVLYAIFVGIGGLVLGYVLRLDWLGRLLLALVCIGRGSMHAEIGMGYYQLGVTQAYFPWVVAAALAIIRWRTRRAPVVGLAIILTLLFWAGNIYYTLPALIMVAALTLAFLLRREGDRLSINFWLIRRVAFALLLTVVLAAVTLIPIYANQQYIGGHPNENPDSIYEDPLIAAAQFFTPVRLYALDTWHETYFSFVLPLWFALLIFALFPITAPRLHRFADSRQHPRVYIVGALMIVLFLVWGTKASPLVNWLYARVPLIAQWRTLSRMLTVSSFWIAVLVAMRVDGLWRALVQDRRLDGWLRSTLRAAARHVHYGIAAVLIVACGAAVGDLVSTWFTHGSTHYKDNMTQLCVNWLRAQHPPDYNLAVFARDYNQVAIYINQRIVFTHINADFHPVGMTPTLYPYDLRDTPPEYLLSYDSGEREYWAERGYATVAGSPMTGGGFPCLMRNPSALSYAFTVPLDSLQAAHDPLPSNITTPITSLVRRPDHVALVVRARQIVPLVVVVQELAWPGWNVTVDGAPARLESVGQFVGVVLPQDGQPHQILFVFDPPLLKLGGLITLLAAAFCILYLLHAERWLPRRGGRI